MALPNGLPWREEGFYGMYSSCDEYRCPCHEKLKLALAVLNSIATMQMFKNSAAPRYAERALEEIEALSKRE